MVALSRLSKQELNNLGLTGTVSEMHKYLQVKTGGKRFKNLHDVHVFINRNRLTSIHQELANKNNHKTMINNLDASLKKREQARIVRSGFTRLDVNGRNRNDNNLVLDHLPFTGVVRIVVYNEHSEVVRDHIYNIENRLRWWDTVQWTYNRGSSETIFKDGNYTVYYSRVVNVEPQKLYQLFADGGEHHCVLQPIIEWANEKMKQVPQKQKTRYNVMAKTAILLAEKYKEGIPEDELNLVANLLKIKLSFSDIFGKNPKSTTNKEKPIRTFSFCNTRPNHLEFTSNQTNVERLFQSEFDLAYEEMKKGFYIYKGTHTRPKFLQNTRRMIRLVDETTDIVESFFKRISKFKLSTTTDKSLHNYIESAINFNSHQLFNDSVTNLFELDMKQGYAQHKACKYYMGFPTIMTPLYKLINWTIKDVVKFIGYYTVVLNDTSVVENTRKIITKLGLYHGGEFILDSPTIKLLYDLDFQIQIIGGTFCYKSMDIEFTEQELESKLYAKIVGKMAMNKEYNEDRMQGNAEFAQHLACTYDNVSQFENEIIIRTKSKKNTWHGHVAGFFTSYCRINTLMELIKLPYEDIYGWKLDGFVIKRNDNIEFSNLFREKACNVEFNWGKRGIFNPIECYHDYLKLPPQQYQLLSGAGGTGKTFNNLTRRFGCLYVSLGWSLISKKKKEFKCKGTSMHRLVGLTANGKKTVPYHAEQPIPNSIFIDEITMIDEGMIEMAVKQYPYSQIILAGDVDVDGFAYQCKLRDVNIVDVNKWFTIEYTTNYRTTDVLLLQKLNILRSVMKRTDGNVEKIKKKTLELFRDNIVHGDLDYNYKTDLILSSTHDLIAEWNELYKHLPKYTCVEHSRTDVYKSFSDDTILLKGDVKIDGECPKRSKRSHGYTIHAIQGRTWETGTLFIDMRRIFDYAQLYTALSRVKFLHQIQLVHC